ncbi:hypothetical protein ElP_02360 [Tautonia plasticadhaerens]|uniref:Uncharacterized protein n=1 Tax=Tautonia plasticadhaerens TaxID=2527974 RepID=A0A518GUY8_9BACT|nr:hypothetical protein ElP_02360 [Tautonia plasticadhaerens]
MLSRPARPDQTTHRPGADRSEEPGRGMPRAKSPPVGPRSPPERAVVPTPSSPLPSRRLEGSPSARAGAPRPPPGPGAERCATGAPGASGVLCCPSPSCVDPIGFAPSNAPRGLASFRHARSRPSGRPDGLPVRPRCASVRHRIAWSSPRPRRADGLRPVGPTAGIGFVSPRPIAACPPRRSPPGVPPVRPVAEAKRMSWSSVASIGFASLRRFASRDWLCFATPETTPLPPDPGSVRADRCASSAPRCAPRPGPIAGPCGVRVEPDWLRFVTNPGLLVPRGFARSTRPDCQRRGLPPGPSDLPRAGIPPDLDGRRTARGDCSPPHYYRERPLRQSHELPGHSSRPCPPARPGCRGW